MNQHTLHITANNQPIVLERLLQVTRYRGFAVNTVSSYTRENEAVFDIELSVSSDHPIDQLYHQLNKLVDITDIKVECIDECKAAKLCSV